MVICVFLTSFIFSADKHIYKYYETQFYVCMYVCNLKQILGMKLPLFPYSSFDVHLETYSRDVRHALK
jgi:hypothetical protein